MRLLLAAGASRDIADGRGETPLDWAKGYGKTAAIELPNEWPGKLAVDEVNCQMHDGSQVMGGLICTVWQELPPQATDSLEQAMEQDLNRVAREAQFEEDQYLRP